MLKIPGTISKVTTLSDGTIRIQVDGQEMDPEAEAEIFRLRNRLGWMVFAPQDQTVEESDIPADTIDADEKSPGQRLRAVLYVYHLQKGGRPEEFPDFYRKKVEAFIQKIKDSIND